jgi:hypothetical protein
MIFLCACFLQRNRRYAAQLFCIFVRSTEKSPLCGSNVLHYSFVLQRNRRYAAQLFCIIPSFYREIAAMRLNCFVLFIAAIPLFYKEIACGSIVLHSFFLQRNRFIRSFYREIAAMRLNCFALFATEIAAMRLNCFAYSFVLQRNQGYAPPKNANRIRSCTMSRIAAISL